MISYDELKKVAVNTESQRPGKCKQQCHRVIPAYTLL